MATKSSTKTYHDRNNIVLWMDIPDYEGYYKISSHGHVLSLRRRILMSNGLTRVIKELILKPYLGGDGYLRVGLRKPGSRKNYKIHQLVAMGFLGHIPCGLKKVVDHKDGNKLNNHVDNLQITTNRDNTTKDRKGGSSKFIGVCLDKGRNKWKAAIQINGKIKNLGRFNTELGASEAYQNKLKTL